MTSVPIDYTIWRDYFRALLTERIPVIVHPSLFVKEGESYEGDAPLYVEEVVGIDGEDFLTSMVDPGLQLTITYNVFTKNSMPNQVSVAEKLRLDIGKTLNKNLQRLNQISIYDIEVVRRIATPQEGWRLSPLDVSFKLCRNQN